MLGKSGSRIETGITVKGYEALIIENRALRVTVLPGKGSDIIEFLYKPQDLDLTWSSAWGLRPKNGYRDFLQNYEGGWQEICPNGGSSSEYRGAVFGQHDEVANLSWSTSVDEGDPEEGVLLSVDCSQLPIRLTKRLKLLKELPTLLIEETLENLSAVAVHVMWGQHLVFGPPFLEPGCLIETGARQVIVTDEPIMHRRFCPGRYSWPYVMDHEGKPQDLRVVPDHGTGEDIVYLTSLSDGYYRLVNPRRQLSVVVHWDPGRFPYLWFWQQFGGEGHPWYGRHYNLGLEPFAGYPTHGIAEAVNNRSALTIAGKEIVSTAWSVGVVEGES